MQAFFLDAADGSQRLCVHHAAQGPVQRGQLLYLHPFAEEMNKSRRMAALLARALAGCGFEVLLIDLKGCGDSAGEFGEASWNDWLDDALLGVRWLQSQAGGAQPLWLAGLRAGCLLAAQTQARLDTPAHLLLMQPPASGKPLLQQFLRLKLAAELGDGPNKGGMAELRATLERGEPLEIAGYALGAALALGLEAASLAPAAPARGLQRLVWLELSSRPDAEWTPVALQTQQRWREAGHALDARLLSGPAFWQSTELEQAPALIEAACELLGTAPALALAPHQEAA